MAFFVVLIGISRRVTVYRAFAREFLTCMAAERSRLFSLL